MSIRRRACAAVAVMAGLTGLGVVAAGGASATGAASSGAYQSHSTTVPGRGDVGAAPGIRGGTRFPSFTFSVVSPVRPAPGKTWAAFDAVATGINDAGVVVGTAKGVGDHQPRAFVSRNGGRGTWLPYQGPAAEATAVSRTGWVIGSAAADPLSTRRPVRWSPKNVLHWLPVEHQWEWVVEGVKTNSSGTILGWVNRIFYDGYWTTWTADGVGGSAAADAVCPYGNCAPADISDAGTIVGAIVVKPFHPSSRMYEAAVLAPGQPRLFPELSPTTESRATAISPNQRYIVGSVWQKGSNQRTGVYYRWWAKPVPLGYSSFDPTDVNDAAVIVGTRPEGSTSTAIWLGFNQGRTLASMTRNLPRGWRLTEAAAVNARGDVAVTALAPSGRRYAARLRVS